MYTCPMSRDANADNGMRPALIEAAARLIATQGAAGLKLRRVAEEVGTSTMAIYTHFGGMPELRRAVRRGRCARARQAVLGRRTWRDHAPDGPAALLRGGARLPARRRTESLYRLRRQSRRRTPIARTRRPACRTRRSRARGKRGYGAWVK